MERPQTFAEMTVETTYYPVVVFAAFVCFLLYKASPHISRKIWRNYDLLPEGVRLEWDTRVISSVHAVCVSLMSSYSQLFDDDMHANLIWWDCPLLRSACAVVAGYLIFDFILITIHFKYLGEPGYYFHHSVSIYAYYYAMSYAVMPFFANFRLLAEISTPFLNLRWFLLVMGVGKSSPVFLLNGVVLLLSFFLCRVLAIPAYWHKVYLASQLDSFVTLGYIPVVLVITCVTLDSLNLFWFYKLLRGLLKILPALLGSGKTLGNLAEGDKRESVKIKSGL